VIGPACDKLRTYGRHIPTACNTIGAKICILSDLSYNLTVIGTIISVGLLKIQVVKLWLLAVTYVLDAVPKTYIDRADAD
jgi:hypothetical protein